jgi:hypothetical protein
MILSFSTLLDRTIMGCILIALDSACFVLGYGLLRFLHISADWVVWALGFVLIVASLALAYAYVTATLTSRDFHLSNTFGEWSFYIAVFAAGQWIIRQWYLIVKKHTKAWLAQQSRLFLIFVRKHHSFFGWLVFAGAVAHMVVFLPNIAEEHGYEIVTGFIAIGILVLSILLGLWIWFVRSIRKQRPPKMIQTIHSWLSIAFLVVVVLHI